MSLISSLIITSLILSYSLYNHMSLITCHSSRVTHLMSCHHVTHLMTLISCLDFISLISCLGLMSLITCHLSHVTYPMSRSHVSHLMSHITCHSSHVTHLISLISCLITALLISCLITMSHISCLIIILLILSYCLYTLEWPHLTSAHDLCLLVTIEYYRWPLPIPSTVTYFHPAASYCQEG